MTRSWFNVEWRIQLATGQYAPDAVAGATWDVDSWDSGVQWGGFGRIWTDITNDFVSAKARRGRSSWGGSFLAGTATLKLKNSAGIYSPAHPGAMKITVGRLIRFVAVIDSVEYAVYTGTVRSVKDVDRPGQVPIMTVTLIDAFGRLARIDRLPGSPVGASELSGARISRLLDSISWLDMDRFVSPGVETLQATTNEGNLLTELYLTSDSEGGSLYVDVRGVVTFADRTVVERLGSKPPLFTVAGYPDPGSSGVWIEWTNFEPDYALDSVVNHASISRTNGVPQVVSDTPSIDEYGKRTAVRSDLVNESDTYPAALATRIVTRGRNPVEKVIKVSLGAGSLAAARTVVDTELGDPIRTSRYSGTTLIEETALIQGIEYTIHPARWSVDITTDRAL